MHFVDSPDEIHAYPLARSGRTTLRGRTVSQHSASRGKPATALAFEKASMVPLQIDHVVPAFLHDSGHFPPAGALPMHQLNAPQRLGKMHGTPGQTWVAQTGERDYYCDHLHRPARAQMHGIDERELPRNIERPMCSCGWRDSCRRPCDGLWRVTIPYRCRARPSALRVAMLAGLDDRRPSPHLARECVQERRDFHEGLSHRGDEVHGDGGHSVHVCARFG